MARERDPLRGARSIPEVTRGEPQGLARLLPRPEELRNFRKIFDRVDTDRSGLIDVKELQELLMDLKHPSAFDDAEVANLFRRVDKDKIVNQEMTYADIPRRTGRSLLRTSST